MEHQLELNFKIRLHHHCLAVAKDKIKEIQLAIIGQKEGASANSSAGDKHNTELAMQHLEEEKKHQLLAVAIQNEKLLKQINSNKICEKVQLGALVSTNHGLFYFSAPVGKIIFEKKEVMLVSLASPLGKTLTNLSVKDITVFNGKNWILDDVI